MKRFDLLLAATALPAAAACAGSPVMRAAERGDRAALAGELAAREKRGEVSNADAASLARAVADREVRAATGTDAVGRVRDVRPCAHELDDALAARMKTHDAAGAEAALARIEARGLDADDARRWLCDADPAWRAVGVRGLVRTQDGDARRKALVDPDPAVRREAVRAAAEAHDAGDLRALSEAARLDPEPIVRTEAVRAIAALPATPGGATADLLRDLWISADDGLREDIALAWASPGVWGTGGREALRVRVAADHGPGAVEAAAAVLRHRDAAGELADEAVGQLVRAIGEGARETRLQAIAEAPLDRPAVLAAVRTASAEEDTRVRVAALARLAETKDGEAVAALEALAQPGSPVAANARFALAGDGDGRVQAWIEQDLGAPHAGARLAAATALGLLGVEGRAAPLLADADPRVRLEAACTILVAARAR